MPTHFTLLTRTKTTNCFTVKSNQNILYRFKMTGFAGLFLDEDFTVRHVQDYVVQNLTCKGPVHTFCFFLKAISAARIIKLPLTPVLQASRPRKTYEENEIIDETMTELQRKWQKSECWIQQFLASDALIYCKLTFFLLQYLLSSSWDGFCVRLEEIQ